MHIVRLGVEQLRNLSRVSLHPAPGLNLIIGPNASGKSSLLEAIHLLALARSFRTRRSSQLVQHEHEQFTLFCQLADAAAVRIGLRRDLKESTRIQVDGRRLKSSSELAQLLPLQLITPESHELINGPPKLRRGFVDWGVFHVEHRFREEWARYVRAIKQRNIALRRRLTAEQVVSWEPAIVDSGEYIDGRRQAYLSQLREASAEFLQQMLPDIPIEFRYHSGWSRELSLAEALEQQRASERERGFTGVGPHRAELKTLVDGHDAASVLSRGQQKLLVCALRLAQAALLKRESGKDSILLIDDLPAELDQERRIHLMMLLDQLQMQTFITATDLALIPEGEKERKVFHVKHGAVSEAI